jgi:hypothetical protein
MNPAALESALRDIEKLKLTAEKASQHENGDIKTFSSDRLSDALSGAWLVVEVMGNYFRSADWTN